LTAVTPGAPQITTPIQTALRACKRHFVGAAIFSALLNLLYLAPTLYMLQVYDRVVPTGGKMTLLFLTFAVLLAIITLSLLDMVRSRLLVRASVRLDRQLAGAVLDASLGRRGGSQSLSRQAVRELDVFRQTLTGSGVLAVFDAPWTPIYMLVAFLIHPLLGLIALIGGALLLLVAWRNEQATREPMQKANEAASLAYLSQEQSAAAADVIRALGMRGAMVRRHLHEREAMTVLQTEASFSASGYTTITRFLRLALQSLALGAGALLAVDNQISGGAIFAASFLVSRAMAPIEQVLGAWKNMIQARGAYRTLMDLFAQDAAEPTRTLLPPATGKITIEGLTVLTPKRDGAILTDIGFAVDKGEIVGIIGPSGAGKSTLVRMIAGAAVPDRGAIRFDGAERGDWDQEILGRQIGYMPQDAALFAGTVKANICRFQSHGGADAAAIDAQVIEAARACGADDMILRLPQGYDTELAMGGRGLSAGQAQRVALARALYGQPSILILDEPNAHLDAEGEARLLETLAEVKRRGGTVLIVAHRTGVLAALDKLVVLRDGRLELFGPRDAVLQRMRAPPPVPQSTAPRAVADATPQAAVGSD
jgi:ATP-binding cassette subfamily C exporter for protease/lipase